MTSLSSNWFKAPRPRQGFYSSRGGVGGGDDSIPDHWTNAMDLPVYSSSILSSGLKGRERGIFFLVFFYFFIFFLHFLFFYFFFDFLIFFLIFFLF